MEQGWYVDVVRLIAQHLDLWDLDAFSRTCKLFYRAFRAKPYCNMLSYPFKSKYKLTSDQIECVRTLMMVNVPTPFKVVHGEVGSGKTWVALSYVFRKYHKLLKNEQGAVLIVVPPSLVEQWSRCLRDNTSLKVLSNYRSSCFYNKDWEDVMNEYQVFVTSNILSHPIQCKLEGRKHIIIHDEAHNKPRCDRFKALEVIGFTASINTFKNRKKSAWEDIAWKFYELRASQITENLPEVMFAEHPLTGYTARQKRLVLQEIAWIYGNQKQLVHVDALNHINRTLTYSRCTEHDITFRDNFHNNNARAKRIYHQGWHTSSLEELVANMNKLPKMTTLLQLLIEIKHQGEKAIVFDTSSEDISLVWAYLSDAGLRCNLFTTAYSAAERPKVIDRFKKNGDVLLGSIKMIGEGHNITEANHIFFLRYPKNHEEFMQALGRCHRYPQKKHVYVHLLASCALEMFIAKNGIRTKSKRKLHKETLAPLTVEFTEK